MPSVTSNLLGNFIGRGIGAALSLLLIPLYIRFLGVEAYGLVGFFLVLQNIFGILDLGLSTTTHREIALMSADEERHPAMRDLLRTVEAIYWPLGLVIGVIVIAAAPWIGGTWLHPESLPVETIVTAIRLMGLIVAVQWPYTIYEGALHGLQRIVAFNTVSAGMQIVRALGALAVVWMWPTITAFFLWQLAVGVVTAALLALSAWRCMPRGSAPRVRFELLQNLWRFAAGMTFTVVLGVILAYADRIVLSRMLSLEAFGYYTISATVASGLLYLMSPISLTVLPRFTELLGRKQHEQLDRTYHLSAQLMTVVLTPVALVVALFAREMLVLWTRNAVAVDRAAVVLTILVSAMLLRTITEIPYMLQLAHGRARLAVYTNLVSVIVYLPLLTLLVLRYGAMGAAAAMLILQVLKFVLWGHIVHRQVLPEGEWRWYLADVGRPALAAALAVALARILIPSSWLGSTFVGALLLAAIMALGAGAAALAAPLARERAHFLLSKMFRTMRAA